LVKLVKLVADVVETGDDVIEGCIGHRVNDSALGAGRYRPQHVRDVADEDARVIGPAIEALHSAHCVGNFFMVNSNPVVSVMPASVSIRAWLQHT
jgi:hypothetical protein